MLPVYHNPLAPPRTLAVAYWENEIGKPAKAAPSIGEIGTALASPNPRTRRAAQRYLELTPDNYKTMDLLKTNSLEDLRKADWALLASKSRNSPLSTDLALFSGSAAPWIMMSFTNDLARVDPGLGLLVSMELAREKKDPTIMDCVAGHKFTEAEIAVIKPDVYRIARGSKLVRDKLVEMKFDAPELSPASLRELENTNLFTLAPEEKK
jgi:hypothetical protein